MRREREREYREGRGNRRKGGWRNGCEKKERERTLNVDRYIFSRYLLRGKHRCTFFYKLSL